MKRKTLTMVLCLLTVLSVVGVGFASWIISADASDVTEGNIVVDTVTDNRLSLSVSTPVDSEGNALVDFQFLGNSANPIEPTAPWLTTDSLLDEVLEIDFTCTVTKMSNETFESIDDVTIGANFITPATQVGEVDDNGDPVIDEATLEQVMVNTTYGDAINAGCIALCTTEGYTDGIKVSAKTLSDDKKSITFTVSIKYVWGTAFGGINPFDYYNAFIKVTNSEGVEVEQQTRPVNGTCAAVDGTTLTANSTWGDHANYYLGLLAALDENGATAGGLLTYSLTINAELA